MRNTTATTCLLAGLLTAAPALAGTVVEVNSSDQGLSSIVISGGQMRMEGGQHVTLFDSNANEMTILSPQDQSYHVVTPQDVQRMAEQMKQVRQQMEQQLENMPEEQREQMRKQMESMMPGGGAPPEIRVEATGGSGSAAGASCRKATLYADDQATHEVCVADPGALGIPSGDFETMMGMFSFFEELGSFASAEDSDVQGRAMQEMMDELGGMPVRSRSLQGGQSWEIVGVETRSVDASRFEVPAGYTERDPMQMP